MKGQNLVLGAALLAFGAGAAEGKGKEDAGVRTPDAAVSSPKGNPAWEQCQTDRSDVRIKAAGVLAELETAARQVSMMPVDQKVPLNLEKAVVCIADMDAKEDPHFSDGSDVLNIGYTREGWAEQKNRDLADCMASERVYKDQTAGSGLEDCSAKLSVERGLGERLKVVLSALKALVK